MFGWGKARTRRIPEERVSSRLSPEDELRYYLRDHPGHKVILVGEAQNPNIGHYLSPGRSYSIPIDTVVTEPVGSMAEARAEMDKYYSFRLTDFWPVP